MCSAWHLEPKAFRQHGRKFSLDFVSLALLFSVTVLAVSCSTTSSNVAVPSSSSSSASLSLTPDNATVASLAQLQFTARVSGTANTSVSWSASAGTISSSGLFTAPQVTTDTPVVIKATSGGQTTPISGTTVDSADASAAVTVTPTASTTSGSLAITASALPNADAGVPYSASLIATGGVAPYAWSLASGSLPAGILLQNSDGI
ncbi:MAG TPA: hypothetical protein VMF10_06720, partial [Candidatus Aquilonibacter sp.]|nr:hypothetical protein [Candidatus Aquilonibacter sp.]